MTSDGTDNNELTKEEMTQFSHFRLINHRNNKIFGHSSVSKVYYLEKINIEDLIED